MTTKNKQDKALIHGGVYERTFGSTATTRILDFLLVHKRYDYSKQDIARYSDVSQKHALITINKLEKLQLIKHTRNVGNNHMYQYNTEDPIAVNIRKLALDIAFREAPSKDEPDPNLILQTEEQKENQHLVEVPA